MLMGTTFWALLAQRARATPDALLLIDGLTGQQLTSEQTRRQAERLAAALLEQGVLPGSTVTWQFPTGVSSFVLQMALARLGVVQNPLISLYGRTEVAAVMRRSASQFYVVPQDGEQGLEGAARRLSQDFQPPPKLIIVPASLPEGDVAGLPPEPEQSDEVRWIYVTSGSTAEPKGVRHSDNTLMRAGANLAQAMAAGPQDVGSIAFPIAHVGGAMYTAMVLMTGAQVVLLSRFQPAEAVAVFTRHRVSMAGGSTAHYQALLAEQRRTPGAQQMPCMRLLSGGGAPKPPVLVAQVQAEMGCALVHAYGMTEVPLVAAGRVSHTPEQLAHTDGAVVAGVEVKIVCADGRPAARGEDGEICVRGPGVFKGYTDPHLTATCFDAEGWFRTGDVGRLRLQDGHLCVTGRIKDIIIRKGENISAREVEDILAGHPKVACVAVIGVPDATRGERVCAVVEPRVPGEHLQFDEMVGWFEKAGVMRQKIPEQLESVDALPRLSSLNKVSKAALRQRYC